MAVTGLKGLGADNIPYDPMLDYWLRMTAGAFTGIGVFSLVVALSPNRYQNVIGILGLLTCAEGMILLTHGLRLGIQPFPFYSDTLFCLCVGAGMWFLRNETKPAASV